MTLHTVTLTKARCDGQLATACDALHPDRPHTCPATISIPSTEFVVDVLHAARWATVRDPGGHLRHFCPTHREQGLTVADPPREGHICDGSDPYCDGCRTFAGDVGGG